ncbi:MAG: hypothetical protein ABEJ59_02080 [Halanaeroarchaeum sp.]
MTVVGAALLVAGSLPFVGVGVGYERAASWAFAIGLAMAFRGYTGGCLSGLVPGVSQCNVEESAEK